MMFVPREIGRRYEATPALLSARQASETKGLPKRLCGMRLPAICLGRTSRSCCISLAGRLRQSCSRSS
jgi:hypothetical protein